jgi:hypothetical protein
MSKFASKDDLIAAMQARITELEEIIRRENNNNVREELEKGGY